jgi:hypothetical protein
MSILDEIDHLIQSGIDPLPVIPDRTNPQNRPLPQILGIHLGDGDVEPFPRSLHEALEHLSLALQGKIFVEEKLQVTNPNDHFPLPSLLQMGRLLFDNVGLDDVVD